MPTSNLTFTVGTWYEGVLTYQWNSGCEAALEINYTYSDDTDSVEFDVWSPNGTTFSLSLDTRIPIVEYILWMGDIVYTAEYELGHQIITNPNTTTYYTVVGLSKKLELNSGNGLYVGPDIWVSCVKCKAKMTYQISRCRWNGTRMTGCQALPHADTQTLETGWLDRLSDYLNIMPVAMAIQGIYLYNGDIIEHMRQQARTAKTEGPP